VNRAKAMILCGAIFKATMPDESDEERRELERMVAEAATSKSKHAQTRAAAKGRKPDGAAAAHLHAEATATPSATTA
jgi:hypothetical protein